MTLMNEYKMLFTASCICTLSAKILTRHLSRQRSTGTLLPLNILLTRTVIYHHFYCMMSTSYHTGQVRHGFVCHMQTLCQSGY